MTQDRFLLTTGKNYNKDKNHEPFLASNSPEIYKTNPLKILRGTVRNVIFVRDNTLLVFN